MLHLPDEFNSLLDYSDTCPVNIRALVYSKRVLWSQTSHKLFQTLSGYTTMGPVLLKTNYVAYKQRPDFIVFIKYIFCQ